MRTSIFSGSRFGLAAGVVALGWAVPAAAAECVEDGDCPKGFTCEVSESPVCLDVPPCPEGESCEEAPECKVEEYSSCVSIDCSADSDCADGMVCETVTHERCSTPGAPADPGTEPDSDADPLPPDAAPPEGSCEVEERNYCMPKYLLPCEVAADCGAGFTCETTLEECSCSSPSASTSGGSGSMPDGDGSDSDSDADDAERPASPPPDGEDDGVDDGCVCEPVEGRAYCQLVVTECAANSDCPSGMTCEDNPEGSCSSTPEGGEECTADPEKVCLPPYVDYAGGVIEEDGLGSGPDTGSGEPPRGTPGEGDDDSNEAEGSADSSASGGGCSVGAAGAPVSAWASLGLVLGAALLGRRRRR